LKIIYFKSIWFTVFLAVFYAGCSNVAVEEKNNSIDYLARIDDNFVITPSDFYQDLEVEKISCIKNIEKNNNEFKVVKTRLFNKMIEEMIILKTADTLNITVSPQELDDAIKNITHDYPEGEFEKSLMKNAVTLQQWKKKLKNRLIIKKVITHELEDKIIVKPDELAEYYQKFFSSNENKIKTGKIKAGKIKAGKIKNNVLEQDTLNLNTSKNIKGEDSEAINRILIMQLRSKKAEDGYGKWIEQLWNRYNIKINSATWEKILKTSINNK